MGTSLTGTTPQDTYDSLIKVTDNGPLSATAKYLSDGLGNDSALALSTTAIGIGTNSLFGKFNLADASNARLEITPVADGVSLEVLDSARANPLDFKVFANDITLNTKVSGSYSERMRIDSSGNVGIGTSSPVGKLTIQGTSAQPPTSGTTPNSLLQIKGSLGNQLNIGSNTAAGDYGSYIQAGDNNLAVSYPLNLQPNGGNVGIGTASPSGILSVVDSYHSTFWRNANFGTSLLISADAGSDQRTWQFSSRFQGTGRVDLAVLRSTNGTTYGSSPTGLTYQEMARFTENGLTFNGDTAAANALDDYEEGTWTPTYSSTGATFTYLGQGGAYTKIGRQVWAQFYVRVTATGTLTNTVIIDGLPFTSSSSALVQSSASVWYTGTKSVTPLNAVNSTSINLWVNNVATPSLLLASDVASGEYMVGTLTYFV